MTIRDPVVDELRSALRGQVLCPGDPDYDTGRRIYNAMIDRRPALIARCAGAADVVTCVQFARTEGLEVAVRGGGHNVSGKAVGEGLMIDLSPMKGVRIDPQRRTARAEAGLTLAELDRDCQRFGLATPLGVVSATGIAGLTLGGGMGWLGGKHGLACDNVISVDIVTAEGVLLTASATEHADLFWAVRGGGGNFGVVTSFEYRLHEVGPVIGGAIAWPLSQAKGVRRFYDEFARACPDELSLNAALAVAEDSTPVLGISVALQQMHGAAARVPPTETAFAHRHDQWDCEMLGQWEHLEGDERCIRWTREAYAAMEPHLERTVYVNALGGDEPERVPSAYGANYDRLAAIKARYDPANFFRANHNVGKGG